MAVKGVYHPHYHLQVQPNLKKKCTKKPTLFLVSMGKTGLSHDIFFLNSQLSLLRFWAEKKPCLIEYRSRGEPR